jgi:Rad3-related DNA helicase
MASILNYFPPGKLPRDGQKEILLRVEAEWDRNDVIVITAPTAAGKTEIAFTIAAWARGPVNYLQPDNILVNQATERYSEFVPLHRRKLYPCLNLDHADPEKPCQCQFRLACSRARMSKIRLMNYWMYFSNRQQVPAQTLVFDEGHRVVDMLESFNNWKLLQSKFGFPSDMRNVADFLLWAQAALERDDNAELTDAVRRLSQVRPEQGLVQKKYGKDVALEILPITANEFGHLLWPKGRVKKLVFMSATIGAVDMISLGLDNRRIAYLSCDSPIPAVNRPLQYEPRYNLSHGCVPMAMPILAQTIQDLLKRHPNKGIIHVPYGLASKLQILCNDPRLLYHTKRNKAAVLQAFKDSPPDGGAVLVASGLYEGVDLPYDAARWQLIAKVPYLSFADPVIELRAKHNPDWYAWETIKRLLQAYGRIVRAPDDFGVTYICDTNFKNLWNKDKYRQTPMFPKFVRDALKGIK